MVEWFISLLEQLKAMKKRKFRRLAYTLEGILRCVVHEKSFRRVFFLMDYICCSTGGELLLAILADSEICTWTSLDVSSPRRFRHLFFSFQSSAGSCCWESHLLLQTLKHYCNFVPLLFQHYVTVCFLDRDCGHGCDKTWELWCSETGIWL